MATARQSYWSVVRGVRAAFDLSLPEARATWRHLRDRLDRRPLGVDLGRHPRIVSEEVRAARLELVGQIDYVRRPEEEEFVDYDTFELTADTAGDT